MSNVCNKIGRGCLVWSAQTPFRSSSTYQCMHPLCVCECLNASLLKGSYVLMRCKWLREVVSHSFNGTPHYLWSPDFGGPGVVIVMLPRPPDRLWRIGFDWSIDRHVAASFSFSASPSLPLASFSHELFHKKALRNWTACHIKYNTGEKYCSKQEMSSPSGVKDPD